ncbi:MAG: trigger factor [Clostridia bacterium]|nr:trigger factor [Clostridia bacterium]
MSLKSAEKTATNEYTLEIAIDAASFDAAVNKVYNREKGKINVPGFRKGKAPRAFIEKMYGKGVFYDDALDLAFPDVYSAAIEEAGITPVDQPRDFEIKTIGEEGVELTCKVTVKPEITVEGYKGISAPKAAVEVTAEEVEAEFNSKLEANARISPVEDRASKMGDITVIDFEGFVDGVAFEGGKGEEYELTLGSGSFIPGFEEQVADKNIGEEFDVNVTFPTEYTPELAGKEAVFKCKLHAIKEKILPEADDEFAKDVSEFDTVAELKADIEKTLRENKEKNAQRDFENAVFEKLADLVEGEIPEVMFDKQVDDMVNEFSYRIQSQGISLDMYLQYLGMDMDALKENYRPAAVREVKISLALEKIAAIENIEVSDEEVEAEYAKMAEMYGVDAETVRKAIAADTVAAQLKANKANAVITDNAVVEKAKKKAAPKKKAAAKTEEGEEAAAEEKPAKKTTRKTTKKAAAEDAE